MLFTGEVNLLKGNPAVNENCSDVALKRHQLHIRQNTHMQIQEEKTTNTYDNKTVTTPH